MKVEDLSSFMVNYFSKGAVYLKRLLTITLITAIKAGAPYFTSISRDLVCNQISQYFLLLLLSISVNVVLLKSGFHCLMMLS